MSTLICRTRNCKNIAVPIEMDLTVTDQDTGVTVYVDQVTCGVCGQPITDITPPLDPGAPA